MSTPDTAAIYDALAEDLRGFVLRRVVDARQAEDLLQEVFLRVHRHRHELRHETRVAAWVYRIARNVVADHHRRHRPTVALSAEPAVDCDDGTEAEARAAARVLGRWLAATIETLPEPYREALRMTELQGLSQAEAARRLGISYSGLKSRVQRGRAKLRTLLQRCCDIELDAGGAVTSFRPRPTTCAKSPAGECC